MGWYRRTLDVPREWAGKRLLLEFDGARGPAFTCRRNPRRRRRRRYGRPSTSPGIAPVAPAARPDHPARRGNDGDPESAWLAAPDDASPWYLVDLEGFYQIATGRTVLADPGNTRYIVEISRDAKQWTLAVDRRETVNESATRNDIYDPGTVARYLRLRFTHVPEGARPGIAEMEIFGILSVR